MKCSARGYSGPVTIGNVELLVRLVVAAALGAVVGLEREAAGRGAGGRTHALVALGAALFTIAGAYGFADARAGTSVDPGRVAAQVAAGVGFIGAGAIIRHGTSVLGITTAATVWLSAAIGVMAAAGGETTAAMATGASLVILVALRAAKPWTHRIGRRRTVVEIEYLRGHGTLGPLLRMIDDVDARLERLLVDDDDRAAGPDGLRHVTLYVNMPRGATLEHLVDEAARRPEIRGVRIAGGGG